MIYLDTSAVAKVLIEEEGSLHVRSLFAKDGDTLVSSRLLFVEMHRIARRDQLNAADVDAVLAQVDLIEISKELMTSAAHLPCDARTLDSIHLATALHLADSRIRLLTYDTTMATAAADIGVGLYSN
ncbi:MAG: PIN domain-containing protein [Acidimicrobiia bacterium]|nr:PIN domain-containing protein [Acidimicrobiia bacterium]